jgi:hypothetical protein
MKIHGKINTELKIAPIPLITPITIRRKKKNVTMSHETITNEIPFTGNSMKKAYGQANQQVQGQRQQAGSSRAPGSQQKSDTGKVDKMDSTVGNLGVTFFYIHG